jgi:small conductance mechanosensitive channel
LILWFPLALPFSAPAAQESAVAKSELSRAQIEGLIKKLDDPERRAALIGDLRLLLETIKGADQPTAPDLLSKSLEGLASRLTDFGADIGAMAENATRPGAIANWFTAQVKVAERRDLWSSILFFLGLAVAAGVTAAWALTRALPESAAAWSSASGPCWWCGRRCWPCGR